MKTKLTKIFAAVFSMTLLLSVLTACNNKRNRTDDTTLASMAPEDNIWRDALPTGEHTTETDATEAETKAAEKTLTGISLDRVSTFGSTGNDMFERVIATADGGYAAIGFFGAANGDCKDAKSNGWSGTKSMLVKFDLSGKVEWSAFLGGDNNGVIFNDFAQLADKSYVVVGHTTSSELGVKQTAALEGLMVKYSASGKLEWTKLFGGTKSEYLSSAVATPDGGFIVGGKTESSDGDFAGLKANTIKAVLIKFDSTGTPRWKRALSGKMHSSIEGLAVNKNGDVFAACITMSTDGDFAKIAGRGQADTVILKYDKDGTFKWVNTFAGSGVDELTSIAPSPDGGCVIAGRYSIDLRNDASFKDYFNAGSFDAFLVKYSSGGSLVWAKPIAGFLNDEITGITAVNGGYVAVGNSESNNRDFSTLGLYNKGKRDGFVLLINELGKPIKALPIAGTDDDVARSVSCRNGFTVFVAGGTTSDDNNFKDLTPAAGKGTFNCFTAALSTSF
ncbi:MAG: hypothetical protein WCN92_07635 [Eubacteriales bacterium]